MSGIVPYEKSGRWFHRVWRARRITIKSMRGQLGAAGRWRQWAHTAEHNQNIIWVHAPSVGEALVGEPVIRRLLATLKTQTTIIHTHTSPSISQWPSRIFADHVDFLPQPASIASFLETLNPSLILYPRGDLWPHVVKHAHRLSIPQVVIGGQLSAGARRLHPLIAPLFAKTASRLTRVFVCAESDVRRWQALGVAPNRITVTGDPRDDQVLERTPNIAWLRPLVHWTNGEHVLVAGSTHMEDYASLLPPLPRIIAGRWRAIIVPHDPTPSHVANLRMRLDAHGVQSAVWTEGTASSTARVIILGSRGYLQDVYVVGSVAYVGGGFSTGVHSVAEPAAYAIPIIAGQLYDPSPDVQRFVSVGGLAPITDPHGLWAVMTRWMQSDQSRHHAGRAARLVLGTGAASRTKECLLEVLGS